MVKSQSPDPLARALNGVLRVKLEIKHPLRVDLELTVKLQLRNKWYIYYNYSSLTIFILLPCGYNKNLIIAIVVDTYRFPLPNQVLIYTFIYSL